MMMMHRQPAILSTLFIICLLLLSSSPNQGYGREMGVVDTKTFKYHDVAVKLVEGFGKLRREMIEVMDYDEPGANTNPKYGFLVTPPPPPAPPRPF